jgi:nucleoid-associated protein YgaU
MRYSMRQIINNNFETYEEILEKRGLRKVNHFKTPKLRHLSPSQIRRLNRLTHVWTVGDRFYKLAHKHYGNSKYWWVIAWYNKRPTESHVQLGDLVFIPQPLEDVLRYLGI